MQSFLSSAAHAVPQSLKRFVWVDAGLNPRESFYESNKSMLNLFHAEGFVVKEFFSKEAAIGFLKEQDIKDEKWLVVTSGQFGEDLVQKSEHLRAVPAYLVFCMNVEGHKKWATKYPKVKDVLQGTEEVVKQIHRKIDECLAITFHIVVSAPVMDQNGRNIHKGIVAVNKHYTGCKYPDGKDVNLMMVLITTKDPFELELDPNHDSWFKQWKGQVRGALESIQWYLHARRESIIINLIALKGGPCSQKEAQWLTDNRGLLERHYPFAAVNLFKDLALDDYVCFFAGKGIQDRGGKELGPPSLPKEEEGDAKPKRGGKAASPPPPPEGGQSPRKG